MSSSSSSRLMTRVSDDSKFNSLSTTSTRGNGNSSSSAASSSSSSSSSSRPRSSSRSTSFASPTSSTSPNRAHKSSSPSSRENGSGNHGSVGISRSLHLKEDPKLLLANLTSNAQYGPAIKAVYDRGWQHEYSTLLDASIERKKSEIGTTCRNHSDEFVGSVDSLLSVNKVS